MGLDLVILLLIAVNAWSGAKRGLWGGLIDLVSLPVALGLASWLYPLGERFVGWLLGLEGAFAGALGFLLVAVVLVLTLSQFSRLLPRPAGSDREAGARESWDRAGGVVTGGLMGVVLAVVLLAAVASTPAGRSLKGSWLGSRMADGLPRFYTWIERHGFAMPKMTRMPRDYRDEFAPAGATQLRFRKLNFARFDGSTCIRCRGPMQFLGYQRKEDYGPISPKFQCSRCGRTTDGCQAFHGFHEMYGRCPVEVADDGFELDCGVWTNGLSVVPCGACPVCGRRAQDDPCAVSPDGWMAHQ